MYSIVPQHDSQMLTGRWTWMTWGVGFASAFTGLSDYGDSTNVECLYEMDDFKTFTEYAHKWYEEGYVMADAMSNTEAGDSLILGGKSVLNIYKWICRVSYQKELLQPELLSHGQQVVHIYRCCVWHQCKFKRIRMQVGNC